MSGADAMMSSKPNLYKQLQSVKPAADVIESIDMGEIYIHCFPPHAKLPYNGFRCFVPG